MRTPEQIHALRLVLCRSVGPYAFLMPEKDVNDWADTIQRQVDQLPRRWRIKVRADYNKDVPWGNIEFEPKIPECSTGDISKACSRIMTSNQKILSMQISDADEPTYKFVIDNPIRLT